ncbi:MAG TPA: tetratricopeptide repeat protein, partial [Thermoanaerobaculia bacterium]
MPDRDNASPLQAPFDQGVFLLHYNRGREAFQEARFAEARRELENAQKLRPDDAEVLNLLGLVYFKTNAFPEAEVIYRRLARENPKVFILHSNLGLILFKQGKLDDAEEFLLRSVELRPNYAKSHLYLGLLYRARRKYNLAIEHLKFASADKLVREVENEVKQIVAAPFASPSSSAKSSDVTTAKIPAMRVDARTQPAVPRPRTDADRTLVPGRIPTPLPARIPVPPTAGIGAAHTAARKLQDAVDETQAIEEKRITLERKIEGASKTFVLHENGFLEINFGRSVYVKRGTVSSYSGNLKFLAESGLLGTTAQTMVKATGQGKIFVYEK